MIKVNMMSSNFAHAFSSCLDFKPTLFEWDFNGQQSGPCVYVDRDVWTGMLNKHNGDTRIKFLWCLESPEFNNNTFDFIVRNLDSILDTYEAIFTYSEELLVLDSKFKKVYTTNTWIEEPKLYEKTKATSMITSPKTYTEQQRQRVEFAKNNSSVIDVFGVDFKSIERKEDGLKDYMFSVAIENATYDTYFTEKVLDCFATGTIPIYKGTKRICEYFDRNGILFLDDIDQTCLTPDLYFSKIESIKRNLELVRGYKLVDDYIFSEFLSKYI